MQYFDSYLPTQGAGESIDISVHCDVETFEWLISYMQDPEVFPLKNLGAHTYQKTKLNIRF